MGKPRYTLPEQPYRIDFQTTLNSVSSVLLPLSTRVQATVAVENAAADGGASVMRHHEVLATLVLLLLTHTTQAFGPPTMHHHQQQKHRYPQQQSTPRHKPLQLPPIPAAWRLMLLALLWPVTSLSPLSALAAPAAGAMTSTTTVADEKTPKIDLSTISKLQDQAFSATNRFQWKEAERAWTRVIDVDPENAAAISNRGNTRTSMGLCKEAKEDFNRAIELAPNEPDPNLGRGVAEECLGEFEAALGDYAEANKKNIALTGREDPVTYNNRANAEAGLGRWEDAVRDYKRAAKMQPGYVFPLASAALASYQIGDDAEAIKQMRLLLVKYPELVDMKAALAVIYWKQGDFAKAETAWYNVLNEDPR